MIVPFNSLSLQYQSLKKEIDKAIAEILNNNIFIGGSPVRQFEEAWAHINEVEHCVSVANGTDSMEIILKAWGIGPGHEVIIPSHTWISTAEAVIHTGACPVFVDSKDRLYTIDVEKIEEKITSSTRAIIPVHLAGLPCDMDPVMDLAAKHQLLVLEDAAQAHLASYKGRTVGGIGHAASFSFYPGKNLGAYGDAGSILTNDAHLANECRKISNHGQLKKHDHQIAGRNSRLDTLQAAVLLAKLPRLREWTEMRREKAAIYTSLLPERFKPPVVPNNYGSVWHLYIIQVEDREKTQKKLKEAGIETLVHYPVPLPEMPALKDYQPQNDTFPVHRSYVDKILSLPIFPELTAEQIDHVCEVLHNH